ncbi:hypothetical protein Sipo8835_24205 [Streptomyces ipomoeae]|uniref:Uncharacterized protein n=1 Tax=Streptomyces ipomoeae TaxID=103232 RepID=A0AAE8W2S0_9ACTN|nr:hypothetical protein [Streptomyces ipomoeae]TQE29969.1 hypothetical protein Sipo8835_24205 [Streptomyces ipomoeae]TQE39101.1 hypothetical protein Sipo7851_05100 [Streptomyces ipomoeae]
MTDQSPDLRGEAVEPHYARTTRGRHAVPRTSTPARLRLPLGKALALTALPTVLVLASQRPPAVDTSATAAHSAPEEEPGGGVDCARPDDTAAPATAPTPSAAPSTPSAPTSGEPVKPSEHAADEETGPAPAPTTSPSANTATTGLADILGSLLHGDTEQQSPAPDASPAPSLAAPTPTPTAKEPSDSPPAAPRASPTPGRRTAEPSSRPAPTPGATRTCDISDLKAPEDTSAGRFPAESWNMKGSRLELRDLVFGGVVTVGTAAGPKRVLKFSAAAVTIRDLKMAVPVGPQIQHIDGAPGSTSTLRGDRITMYVESLTGTLSGVEGIPLPPALRLHLTPGTVPEWLYGTVGKLDLKLRLDLADADIDQAGQVGGELVIPGIHGYGTPR